MANELVERLDEAASELLAYLKGGEVSSEEALEVLSGTRAVRGKLDTVQALAAASVAGSRNHGDGGAHVLAESTGMSRRDARSQVRTITAVGAMPAVRDAVEDGRVSVANAGRLADALDKTSAAEVESDGELLAKAESLSPEQFAREAKRWTAERQADGGEAAYRRLRVRRAVRVWDGDDGMVHLYGQFDPVTGRRIRNRLNRDAHRLFEADKRHARGLSSVGNGRALHGADEGHARAGGEMRSLKQCMADALDHMTRGTAGGGKPYADIALVARLDPDTEKLMVSTADGDPLPASVIERLAGESSWFALVLNAKGVPMWKGRNTRRATESQFQALMALYGGCAGCGEPDENKVHAHHMDPFALGRRHRPGQPHTAVLGLPRQDPRPSMASRGRRRRQTHHQTPDRIHHGPARLPDTAPLFGPAEQGADAAPEPAPLFGPAEQTADTAPLFGPSEQTAETVPLFGPSEQTADTALRPAAGSGGAGRAGPTGPEAARDALRRARAARHDTQAVRA